MEKFQIEHVIISMSLEVEGHTVPHSKAPVSCKLVSRGQSNGSIFSLSLVLLKSVYLHHKWGLGWFVSLSTVASYTLGFFKV